MIRSNKKPFLQTLIYLDSIETTKNVKCQNNSFISFNPKSLDVIELCLLEITCMQLAQLNATQTSRYFHLKKVKK